MDAELFIDSVIKPKCRRWRPKKILVSVSVLVGCWGISLDNVWQAGGEDRGGQADKQLHLSDPTSSQCWSATSLDHQWTFLLFLPASKKNDLILVLACWSITRIIFVVPRDLS